MRKSKFEFEPIERASEYRAVNHTSLNAYNNRRALKRDDLIAEYGIDNALTQDNIENYHGEYRRSSLEHRSFNGNSARKHYEIKQKKVKLTEIQIWERSFV